MINQIHDEAKPARVWLTQKAAYKLNASQTF